MSYTWIHDENANKLWYKNFSRELANNALYTLETFCLGDQISYRTVNRNDPSKSYSGNFVDTQDFTIITLRYFAKQDPRT